MLTLTKKQKLAFDYIAEGHNVFLTGPAGTGKCLAKDTPVLMYNGDVKAVQDIHVGELVMGDDSSPRKVLNLSSGASRLYRVSNSRGDSYVVNESHVLTCKPVPSLTWLENLQAYRVGWFDGNEIKFVEFSAKVVGEPKALKLAKYFMAKLVDNEPVDIPVKTFLETPDSTPHLKGIYTSISFRRKQTTDDPNALGKWVGSRSVESKRRIYDSRFDHLEKSLRVPKEYLSNDTDVHASFFAGLLESGGKHNEDDDYYTISFDSNAIVDDIIFIVKALGLFAVRSNSDRRFILKIGDWMGVERLENGFFFEQKVEDIGLGEYYGFELDKNRRFVLGNFIVTHNSSIIQNFRAMFGLKKTIAVTSTTGISAILIGGTTLHSYLGIGLGQGTANELADDIYKKAKSRQKWVNLDVLIIDEVSMLSPELFDKLDYIGKKLRRSNRLMGPLTIPERPFGGIQLVLCGDFLQLPVVGSDYFCFESDCWKNAIDKVVYLTEIIRQPDPEFQSALNDLRYGILTKTTKRLLKSRIGVELKNDLGIKPTRIYTTNAAVDHMNESELDLLAKDDRDFYQYDMDIEFLEFVQNKEQAMEKYRKTCIAPPTIQLCVGAQVMLLANLDVLAGLANGSRGVVISFVNDLPMVRFLNGLEQVINYYCWEIGENRKKQVRIVQIPLKLAWSVTVHKCVGLNTLIFTENGIVPIKQLELPLQRPGESKDTSIDIHTDKGIEKCTQVFKGIEEKTIIITTSKGYSIECSYRHPLLTKTEKGLEWKKAPGICRGDLLALKKNMMCSGKDSTMTEAACRRLGLIHSMNPDKDEKLPNNILCKTLNCQKAFVEGLTDGCKQEDGRIVYTTTSKTISDEIQILLLNIGKESERLYHNSKNSYTIEWGEGNATHTQDFYDHVVKLVDSTSYVYDVYVPGSHTFVGNGFVNHNSQGCTLDYAEIDLSNVFAPGQVYVALSRVKSKEGLSIIDINYDGVQAHPKAVEYYKNLE